MNKDSDWSRVLKEEVGGLAFSEDHKDRVIDRAKLSFWNREVRIPIPIAVAAAGLSILIVVLPILFKLQEGTGNRSTTVREYREESYMEIDGMLILKQLLVKGEQP
ncbi:hypothetical protein [Paenibacillus marinisediminis]